MKLVQFGRRMLWSCKFSTSCVRKFLDLRGRQEISHEHCGWMQCHMRHWQHALDLRRSHRFAAVVTLVRRVAGHGTAALHALLVPGRGGHAVRKLQAQQGDQRHDDE